MNELVVCVGLVTLDIMHEVDRVPRPDEKLVDRGQRIEVGGPAANAAVAVSALGGRARLVAPFGQTPVTGYVADRLAEAGVEWIDPAGWIDNASPVSTVLLTRSTGQRAVISGGAPPLPDSYLGPEDQARLGGWPDTSLLPHNVLDGAGALLIDGHAFALAKAAAWEARRRGIPVLVDGGSHKPGMRELFGLVDLAVLSADFEVPGGMDPIVWTMRRGCRYAAQSAGSGPIRAFVDGQMISIDVPEVSVVDTLGAGDVLHGALAYAIAQDGLRAVAENLRYAGAMASESCEHAGVASWAHWRRSRS